MAAYLTRAGFNHEIATVDPSQVQSQEITLKVTLEKVDPLTKAVTGSSKAIKFQSASYVHDACVVCAAAFSLESSTEWGLYFLDRSDLTRCKWLLPDKTLRFYDIHSHDELTYKKKFRPLRVRLLDGSKKNILIDESLKISEIVASICEKQEISNPLEFSLRRFVEADASAGVEEAEGDWTSPDMTLNEQGIGSDETLVLKKKFFFGDASIDTNDIKTLSLVYEQLRQDVIEGALLVKEDEAIMFAALQAQIILGPHDPSAHNPKAIDVLVYLPREYRKVKRAAQLVFTEHMKLGRSLNARDAKYRFVQLARSLRTFGITVFLVQEPKRDKKTNKITQKFQPCLLGISRSHLHRLDPVTKEPLSPPFALPQLRRWAPSKSSITLDYGDHHNEYYTVLTEEGHRIASIISGYIDLILAQRRDRSKEFEDEQQAVEESTIAPSRAHGGVAVSSARRSAAATTVARPGGGGAGAAASASSSQRNNKQLADVQTVINTFLKTNTKSLPTEDTSSLDGMSADERSRSLQNARDLLAGIMNDLAMSAQDAVGACGDGPALNDIAARMASLGSDLNDAVAMTLRFSAGANENGVRDALVDVSKTLGSLLGAANLGLPSGDSMLSPFDMGDLLSAASALGDAFSKLLGEADVPDSRPVAADAMADRAADISRMVADLCANASAVATATPAKHDELVKAASTLATSSAKFNGSVTLAGPALLDDRVQAQLGVQLTSLTSLITTLTDVAGLAGLSATDMASLLAAASGVSAAIASLTGAISSNAVTADYTSEIAVQTRTLEAHVVALVNKTTDASTAAAAPDVIRDTSTVIDLARRQAELETIPQFRDSLLAAADALARALDDMNAAAKAAKTEPSKANTAALRATATVAAERASVISAQASRKRALFDLSKAARASSATTGELIVSINEAGPHRQAANEARARADAERLSPTNAELDEAAVAYRVDPTAPARQAALLAAVKKATSAGPRLVLSAKVAAPGYESPADEELVGKLADETTDRQTKLLAAFKAARAVCWDVDVDEAAAKLAEAVLTIDRATARFDKGTVVATLDESVRTDHVSAELSFGTQSLRDARAGLLSAMNHLAAEDLGGLAKDAAAAAVMVAGASVSVAALSQTSGKPDKAVLVSSRAAVAALGELLAATRAAMLSAADTNSRQAARDAASELEAALARVLETLPGIGDCMRAERLVSGGATRVSALSAHEALELDASLVGQTLPQLYDTLLGASRALAATLPKLPQAAIAGDVLALGAVSGTTADAYIRVQEIAIALAVESKQPAAHQSIAGAAGALETAVAETLVAARLVVSDQDNLEAPSKLNEANARASAALAELLAAADGLGSSGAGAAELDEAVRRIMAASATLDAGTARGPAQPSLEAAIGELRARTAAVSTDAKELNATARAGDSADANAVIAVAERIAADVDALVGSVGSATVSSFGGAGGAGGSGAAFPFKKYAKAALAVEEAFKALSEAGTGRPAVKAATVIAKLTAEMEKDLKVDGAEIPALVEAAKMIKAANKKLIEAASGGADTQEAADGIVKAGKMVRAASREVATRAKAAADSGASAAGGGAGSAGPSAGGSPGLTSGTSGVLVDSARAVCSAAAQQVGAAKSLLAGSAENAAASRSLLVNASRALAKALEKLDTTARTSAPGLRECEAATTSVALASEALDEATMASSVGELSAATKETYETLKARLVETSSGLETAAAALVEAANARNADGIAKAASKMDSLLADFAVSARGAAAKTNDPDKQQRLLAAASATLAALGPLLADAKLGADPSSDGASAKRLAASLGELEEGTQAVVAAASGSSDDDLASTCDAAMAGIEHAVREFLDSSAAPKAGTLGSYADYQADIKARGKAVGAAVLLMTKAVKRGQTDKMAAVCSELSALLVPMIESVAGAAPSSSRKDELVEAARGLAARCVALTESVKSTAGASDEAARDEALAAANKLATVKVPKDVAALMAIAKAEASAQRDSEEAALAIQAAGGDLDTLLFMATSGQLKSTASEGGYGEHQTAIDKVLGKIVKAVGQLNEGAPAGPEACGAASQKLSAQVGLLRDALELGLGALPDIGAQQSLLAAAQALVEALAALTSSASTLNGNPSDADAAQALADANKDALKAVKAMMKRNGEVEEMATTGRKAIKASMQVIQQAVDSLATPMPAPPNGQAKITPEQISDESAVLAKTSTRLLLAAKKTPQEVAAAADDLTRQYVGFVMRCREAGAGADAAAADAFFKTVAKSGERVLKLLNVLRGEDADGDLRKNPEAQKKLRSASGALADAISEVATASNFLAGDDADETAVALKASAASIEDAEAKLKKMRAPKGQGGEMSFEETVLEAAKTVMAAAQALLKRAVICQKEIKIKQSEGNETYATASDFAEGLISAAQRVGSECRQLVDVSGEVIKGQHKDPSLALKAACKGVSTSAVHLVTAGAIQAGDSKPQQELQRAAGDVKAATKALMGCAEERAKSIAAANGQGDDDDVELASGQVGGGREEFESQMRILEAQRALEEARRNRERLNRAKYRKEQAAAGKA